jgi:hypothetical protein
LFSERFSAFSAEAALCKARSSVLFVATLFRIPSNEAGVWASVSAIKAKANRPIMINLCPFIDI